jgi:hypothetical protein
MQISIRIPKQNDAARRSCYSKPGYSIFVISNLQNTLTTLELKKKYDSLIFSHEYLYV